jgi:uncharacterized membrane protein
MKTNLLHFVSLFLLMLITGVFWGTWFTLTRSLDTFQGTEFIHIGKVIISNVAWPMRILMPAGILLMLISAWMYPDKKSGGFYLMLTSCVLIIVTLLITLLILVPIDNQVKTWTVATLPQNFEAIRYRWETFHAVRTFTSLGSFGCFAWAVVKN